MGREKTENDSLSELRKTHEKMKELRERHEKEMEPIETKGRSLIAEMKSGFRHDGTLRSSIMQMYFNMWNKDGTEREQFYTYPYHFLYFLEKAEQMSGILERNRGNYIIRSEPIHRGVSVRRCTGTKYQVGRISVEGEVFVFDNEENEIYINTGGTIACMSLEMPHGKRGRAKETSNIYGLSATADNGEDNRPVNMPYKLSILGSDVNEGYEIVTRNMEAVYGPHVTSEVRNLKMVIDTLSG